MPSLPVIFVGIAVLVAALILLGMEWQLRQYKRVGLASGGVTRRGGESPADAQRRNLAINDRMSKRLAKARPLILVAALDGVGLIVIGFLV